MKLPRKLTPKIARSLLDREDDEREVREIKDEWRDPLDVDAREQFGIPEESE